MKVDKWETPAAFFPWGHVQRYIDQIDAQVYSVAMDFAQEQFGEQAKSCPTCDTAAKKLVWFSVSSPESDWDTGTGKVGFLTLCEKCKLQVDFLIDDELTEMQDQQWRDIRALS
jgi:hypothetical protein